MLRQNEMFPFVKRNNNKNESNINVKRRNAEKVADMKKLYLHFLPQIISQIRSVSIVLRFWITLYMYVRLCRSMHACINNVYIILNDWLYVAFMQLFCCIKCMQFIQNL